MPSNYYILEPEVPGGFGSGTIISTDVEPPIVSKLTLKFDGWLGDDLLTSFPCYFVTEWLASAITETQLTGVEFRDMRVTKSYEFRELFPKTRLPKFRWAQFSGIPGRDDFGLLKDTTLVVSERALNLIKSFHFKHCDVTKYVATAGAE